MNNNEVFNSNGLVRDYLSHDYFSAAEKKILQFVTREESCRTMLDLGVGGGRTTKFFAPFFDDYTGIDYSPNMIEACRSRFSEKPYRFMVDDATMLNNLCDNTFDFILFSFNGIDCVGLQQRHLVLQQVKRVARNNAWFAFSTHNTNNLKKLYSYQFPRNPLKYPREMHRLNKIKQHNQPYKEIAMLDRVVINDVESDSILEIVYTKPQKQFMELKETGFVDIKILDKIGKDIAYENLTDTFPDDPWLTFLCRIIK